MPKERPNPYHAFNFRVTVDIFGDANSVQAGFQDASGLGIEVAMAEYRNGNEKENHVRKIPGMTKYTDITLKRGLMGSNAFFTWIKGLVDGQQDMLRTVVIELMDEAHTGPVMTWTLEGARPTKYTGPSMNAKGTEVAIEEMTLACHKMVVS